MEYKDITSNLCLHCGECCKIYIPVKGDDRYFEFLQMIGLDVYKINQNNGRVFLGYCKHLSILNGIYKCEIYDLRPQLCHDFNCLAWASYTNAFDKSDLLNHAHKVLEYLNEKKEEELYE